MRATDYMALGLDFGGVVVAPSADDGRHAVELDARVVPPLPGVERAVRELVKLFEGRVWLVSKATHPTRDWTRSWLELHRFCDNTRLERDHVEFVTERNGKRERCLIHGITHFVDDHVRNLDLLRGAVDWLCLFGSESLAESIPYAAVARDWPAASQAISESVATAVSHATPRELQARLSAQDRRSLEGHIRGALEREKQPGDPFEHMDRVDCLIDLNHLFWGVPAATRALLEIARRSDDHPDAVWWAGYYFADLWIGWDVLPLDCLSGLSAQGRQGFLERVEDERPDWAREIRSRWPARGAM